jgi:eukaryotic-like serine/threonine-protein kinase
MPGMRLDRYEIVRRVATGGMGEVWLGRLSGKHGFAREVAIKVIRPELGENAQVRAMLLDEARICARLRHANVAQVLDVGEYGGRPYLVFEWVEGASLAALFLAAERGGRSAPVLPLVRVMADLCEGLHAAHELTDDAGRPLRVVHRDVTPANILVGKSGFAKLIDFGVAHARARIAGETRAGIVKGTPQFMAPEQAQGARVDRRADIWSVGAVLYRGLSGRPPFDGLEALEAFLRGKREIEPLPPSSGADAVDLREIVARAVHRNPLSRFPTAAELGFALERVLHAAGGRPSIADLFPCDDSTLPLSDLPTQLE